MADRSDPNTQDRMASRFDDDDPDRDSSQTGIGLVSAKNVKKEWKALNVYLPEDTLFTRVNKQFDRLNYECDWNIKKNRHYYPLLIAYGIERIEEMEGGEVKELLEGLEL